ncbi:MAG TPA: DUF2442 domain-containing protein [Tepidisphaeraceae bacterium]|jgi:hypothetical protein
MITSANDKSAPEAVAVRVTNDTLAVDLADGRTISVPIDWYPRLVHGTARERDNFEIGPLGIHWPDLDEDVSIAGLLAGRASGETPTSLKRWLDGRSGGTTSKSKRKK